MQSLEPYILGMNTSTARLEGSAADPEAADPAEIQSNPLAEYSESRHVGRPDIST